MDGLNPITRREVFLAAAAGDQVETPEPITREEVYLKKIAEGGGESSLPDTPAEDGTYALQNTVSSGTGTLSWASGSSGGGVLVVHDVEGTLDKTWQEIWDAAGTGPAYVLISDSTERDLDSITAVLANSHRLSTASGVFYEAESANDYPVLSD